MVFVHAPQKGKWLLYHHLYTQLAITQCSLTHIEHVSFNVVFHNYINIQCLVLHIPKPIGGCLQWLSEPQIQLLPDRSLHCSLSMSQTVTQWHLL